MDNKKKTLKEELYGKDYKTIGDHPIDANPIKLLDNFDWAAVGIAACGVVLFLHILIGSL